MEYCISLGYQISPHTIYTAVDNNQFDMVIWLHQNKYPYYYWDIHNKSKKYSRLHDWIVANMKN